MTCLEQVAWPVADRTVTGMPGPETLPQPDEPAATASPVHTVLQATLTQPVPTRKVAAIIVVAATLVVLLNLATFALSTAPRMLAEPGPVLDIGAHLNDDVEHPDGTWFMTTVRSEQLAWWQVAYYRVFGDETTKIVKTADWTGGMTDTELQAAAYSQMLDAQRTAADVALNRVRRHTGQVPSTNADELTVTVDGVGGPSGGLMFTLTFIDALTDGDLTGGLVVAGTGTIANSGAVGPVGGADRKVFAAADVADVFFVPATATAPTAPHGSPLRVIPVDTVDDAIAWLCDHGSTDTICR